MKNVDQFIRPLIAAPEFSTLPLAGDASSRKYYRVVAEDKSWVLMEWEPFDNPTEFPFLSVQKYFNDHRIPVPQVLGVDPQQGLFLLEDLGDLTLERKFWEFQNQENILPYYQATLDELIKIHSLSFTDLNKSCTAYDVEFSTEKLMWEFHYMMDHLVDKKFNLKLTEQHATLLEAEFQSICKELSKQPQVICHRDFHSRNVMIKHGKVQIIDFQDARMGPAVYDLVSLLLDSYVALTPDTIKTLLQYYQDHFSYWDRLAESPEAFQRAFDLQTLQRCLKACGSFASFFNTRGDSRYLKHIPATLDHVQKTLSAYPEFKAIPQLLTLTKSHWVGL